MPIYRRRFHVENDAYDVIFEANDHDDARWESEGIIRAKYPSAKIDPSVEHKALPWFVSGGKRIL